MQLPLGIGLRDDATLDAFYPGENAIALTALEQIANPARSGETLVFLFGESGVGCTHLLQAACHQATQHKRSCAYIALDDYSTPAMLDGLEQVFLVCIDNLERMAGKPALEEALFHCFNRCRAEGTRLVMAAPRSPNTLGIKLPDLVSRLNYGLTFAIKPLNEEGKVGALQRRAQARGLTLSFSVGQFLIKRVNRNMTELYRLLEILDRASMQEKRALTLPFVKKVLAI